MIQLLDFFKGFQILNILEPTYTWKQRKTLIKKIFNMLNITIYVKNLSLLRTDNIVYICNHISELDGLVIDRIINTGYFAKNDLQNTIYRKMFNIDMILWNKDKKRNPIKEINEFVKKNKSILIFPEGTMNKNSKLSKFRSSAFKTDYPVQPLVLSYADNKNITLTILPIEYPPFNIQNIKKNMNVYI